MARILVVDDCDIVRQALLAALRRLGHAAEGLDSPLLALEKVEALRPDLLVLDYRMPEMDGVTLYREVQERLGDAAPAVLFVSGSPVEEVEAQVGHAVRASFMGKPFALDDLEREVEALLAA